MKSKLDWRIAPVHHKETVERFLDVHGSFLCHLQDMIHGSMRVAGPATRDVIVVRSSTLDYGHLWHF